jgi:phosphohistidine phosphatase
MDLILWRHADTEDGFPDMARALTPKGEKQAHRMSAWLKPRLPDNLRILASPARRTQQTAAALGLDFTTCAEIAPGASARALLAAANWPHTGENVLIIGHQPTLGETASYLMTGQYACWSIRKGAVWWFTAKASDEMPSCMLKAVMSADMVEEKHR